MLHPNDIQVFYFVETAELRAMMRVGLIGLGGVGRIHYACWRKCPDAKLVAISARDPRKLAGEWGTQEFNLGEQSAQQVDLGDLAKYVRFEELVADPSVEAVDICLPTPLHAPVVLAALRAGKHVLCEKPMSLSLDECTAMERAAEQSGKHLMIAHCLRYWPHYLKAKEIIDRGEYGRVRVANFSRTSGAPVWGSGWFMRPEESGGVLDMHIHDIDVALWWFGPPEKIKANGEVQHGLPLTVHAKWDYGSQGPMTHLHSAWDLEGGTFRHSFYLLLEKAILSYDLSVENGALLLIAKGQATRLQLPEPAVHQAEIDDFARRIRVGEKFPRISPAESRAAVAIGLEEWRQLRASA